MIASFDWALALRAMNASLCAYQIRSADTAPEAGARIARTVSGQGGRCLYDVAPVYQDAVGFVGRSADYAPAFHATGDDEINAALIGLTTDGRAVLAFRGTLAPNLRRHDFAAWLADWLNDADAAPEPWAAAGPGNDEAETGFARATTELWPWIEETLASLRREMPNGLLVTGHSKGGAMTFLGASLARARWRASEMPVTVYAFAPPVAGNAGFATAYGAAGLAEGTHRVQVTGDAVPFLPRWDQADIWASVRFKGLVARLGWDAVAALADAVTRSGYTAVGDTTVITDAEGRASHGPDAAQAALEAVVASIEKDEFEKVVGAHSAATSYLPMVAAACARHRS